MPPRTKLGGVIFALVLAGTCASGRADTTNGTTPQTYVGVQGLLIVGDHQDVTGTQHGIGGAPLAEVRFVSRRMPRLALHLEGIPVVSAPQAPSAFYGQATPALGIVFASIEGAVDPQKRIWFGIGNTLINQRTPLPNIEQVVSSRLAGARYTFRAQEPLRGRGRARFAEVDFGVSPSLSGNDIYIYSNGLAPVDKNERASELDASVGIGWQRRDSQWLVGLRALNYTAHFTLTGDAADRNVGIGPMVEWRHFLSH